MAGDRATDLFLYSAVYRYGLQCSDLPTGTMSAEGKQDQEPSVAPSSANNQVVGCDDSSIHLEFVILTEGQPERPGEYPRPRKDVPRALCINRQKSLN